ncbi:MAG: DUF4838 domain-containing protein, partial [Candidatus Omnitrophica bacterium]|nr:DUF4838 domain-containing protein [Candidatus Omnitrophota bacterium]
RPAQGHLISGGQLCLSHPDVFRLVRDYVLEKMAEPEIRVVAVAQMDCGNYCRCPECEKKDKAGKSPAASLLDFVNRVAEQTVKFYPMKYVATLAYQYSQIPPVGLRAHKNVIVKLCHMQPSCDFHSLTSCPSNRFYLECLQQWTEICQRVFVWHYATNFLHNLAFHPNFDALNEDIRFYQKAGVWGIFFQGQRQTGVSFGELHAYCQANLAWDTTNDYFQLAREFAQAYYGQAGEAIMGLIDTFHQKVRAGFHGHLFTHPAEGTFSLKLLKKAEQFLKEAEEAVRKEPVLRQRVEMVRLWFDYTWLAALSGLVKQAGSFVVKVAPKAPAVFRKTVQLLKKHQVTHLQEFPASHQDLREKVGWAVKSRKMPVYTLCSGTLQAEIVPELAGMVLALKKKDRKINLLCPPATWILRYPTMGGLTEGCTKDDFGPGFSEAYRLVRRGKNFLVLEARLSNQVVVKRKFVIENEPACLFIQNVYTNRAEKPVELLWHCFALLKLGELKDIVFFRLEPDGQMTQVKPEVPLSTVSASQWIVWEKEKVPAGGWGCFNTKLGLGIFHRFSEQASFCGSNAYTRDSRILLEVIGKHHRVNPACQVNFQHRYRLIENL